MRGHQSFPSDIHPLRGPLFLPRHQAPRDVFQMLYLLIPIHNIYEKIKSQHM